MQSQPVSATINRSRKTKSESGEQHSYKPECITYDCVSHTKEDAPDGRSQPRVCS
jgi:hypothetical protein